MCGQVWSLLITVMRTGSSKSAAAQLALPVSSFMLLMWEGSHSVSRHLEAGSLLYSAVYINSLGQPESGCVLFCGVSDGWSFCFVEQVVQVDCCMCMLLAGMAVP